jgi:hypothetical protein
MITLRCGCVQCGCEEDLDVTYEGLRRWLAGIPIQKVFPHLNASQRELLKTGICGPCFDRAIPDEEHRPRFRYE